MVYFRPLNENITQLVIWFCTNYHASDQVPSATLTFLTTAGKLVQPLLVTTAPWSFPDSWTRGLSQATNFSQGVLNYV